MTDRAHDEGSFKLDARTISLIVTLIAMCVSIGVSWGTLNARVNNNAALAVERQAEMIRRITVLDSQMVYIQECLAQRQEDDADRDIQLANIEKDLAYIRVWIEKQEQKTASGG